MSSGDLNLFFKSWLWKVFSCFKEVFYLLKKPRVSNRRSSNHRSVQAVIISHRHCFFWTVYIAIPKDRDVNSGVVFNLSDWSPIRYSFIHLSSGSPVYG